MIFSRKRRGAGARDGAPDETFDALDTQIQQLSSEAGNGADPATARRILELRHRAGLKLLEQPEGGAEFASPAFDRLPAGELPEAQAADVTPELVRAAMLRSGCLLVRGFIPRGEAEGLAAGIDRAYAAREASVAGGPADGEGYYADFQPDPRFDLETERGWVRDSAGLWAADSPRMMVDVFDAFERAGVRRLVTDYLGERSAISINKCLLRKVKPEVFDEAARNAGIEGIKPSAWHQDGAFMGDVRALNVWLALSRCGDEAPGLDVVPRRIDHIVPTGTEGASFEWSVSQTVADEVAGETGVLRPIFDPGDALLFDELFLHSTAAEPGMPNMRYAVESWFFGGSGFPAAYAPLAF